MIQVIQRAFDILEYISKDPEKAKSLGEIAEKLNLNAGTCANIIKTMVDRKYIEKLDKQKGYLLGPMAYAISGNEGYNKSLVDAAREEMEGLTSLLNENSLLCIIKGDARVVIFKVQSDNDLQANTAREKRVYDTSSGRLLLSMLTDEEIEKFIERYGVPSKEEWEGAADKKGLLKQISKIRKDGYALQITRNQIIGIALPINSGKKTIASLSVYMPVSRYNNMNKLDLIKQIRKSADRISKKL
ncbi:IclR family transcriptional regulator [Pollutibacter soli]|uniref:IclR family transcriptional regulator n=1 Tax=Pollutibacter soli TaxID=3034157 RepID=UPI0030140250